jgi:hypothetical protein
MNAVPKRLWCNRLEDPGAERHQSDDAPGAAPVQPPTFRRQEERPVVLFADRASGARCERDGDDFAALAGDCERAVAAVHTEMLAVGAGGFGDPQAVQCKQRNQRMLAGSAEPGHDEQGADPTRRPGSARSAKTSAAAAAAA